MHLLELIAITNHKGSTFRPWFMQRTGKRKTSGPAAKEPKDRPEFYGGTATSPQDLEKKGEKRRPGLRKGWGVSKSPAYQTEKKGGAGKKKGRKKNKKQQKNNPLPDKTGDKTGGSGWQKTNCSNIKKTNEKNASYSNRNTKLERGTEGM